MVERPGSSRRLASAMSWALVGAPPLPRPPSASAWAVSPRRSLALVRRRFARFCFGLSWLVAPASCRAIAIACFGFFTFGPLPRMRNSPCLNSCITRATVSFCSPDCLAAMVASSRCLAGERPNAAWVRTCRWRPGAGPCSPAASNEPEGHRLDRREPAPATDRPCLRPAVGGAARAARGCVQPFLARRGGRGREGPRRPVPDQSLWLALVGDHRLLPRAVRRRGQRARGHPRGPPHCLLHPVAHPTEGAGGGVRSAHAPPLRHGGAAAPGREPAQERGKAPPLLQLERAVVETPAPR